MRRLRDQALVLRAIGDVREELRVAEAQGGTNAQLFAILGRLVSLYAILNVEQLEQAVIDSDTREDYKEAA
jgi:hypothetical protein